MLADFTVPPLLAYTLAWFGFMAGVWALFEHAETVLRPDIRERLSAWLRNDRTKPDTKNWPKIFADIFDSVFGTKHWSWKCFNRDN